MKEFSPFSMNIKTVTSAVEPDLSQAVEITPMVRFGLLLPGAPVVPSAPNASPNHQVEVEVKEPVDADPKDVNSSVTDSASLLPSGTVENGPNATDLTKPIHPSTLSETQETLVTAEKVSSLPPILPMQIG